MDLVFMFTFITAMRECPKLAQQSGPAVQVLKRCIDKKIWTTPLWKGFLRSIKDYSHLDPVVAILRSLPQKQLLRALKDGGPEVHSAFTAHMGKFDHIPQRYLDALEKTKPTVRYSLYLACTGTVFAIFVSACGL